MKQKLVQWINTCPITFNMHVSIELIISNRVISVGMMVLTYMNSFESISFIGLKDLV